MLQQRYGNLSCVSSVFPAKRPPHRHPLHMSDSHLRYLSQSARSHAPVCRSSVHCRPRSITNSTAAIAHEPSWPTAGSRPPVLVGFSRNCGTRRRKYRSGKEQRPWPSRRDGVYAGSVRRKDLARDLPQGYGNPRSHALFDHARASGGSGSADPDRRSERDGDRCSISGELEAEGCRG